MSLLPRTILRVLRISAAIFAAATTAAGTASSAESTRPLAVKHAAPLILDDAAQPLPSRPPQSEAHRDHLDAVAMFAAGRMHEQREEYADALRCYERALRCDPQSSTVARAVVPVAVRLKYNAEAIRYAMKALELEDADPLLLRRLGDSLTDDGDWVGAVNLYEKALAARSKGKETANDILLRMEMGASTT